MRPRHVFLIIAIGVLALAGACGAGDPQPGQSGDGDGGVAALAQRLRDAGAEVEAGGAVAQPFFAVPGQLLTVNGASVQVFAYPSVAMAEADAAKVSPRGDTIGTTSVLWVSPPHFFRDAELLALYIGDDDAVVELLASVLGPRFAGGARVPVTDVPEVPEAVDAAARAALAERLGVPPGPGSLLLVRAAEVTFSNGSLGCPQPGFAYTEALVPGFELLYQHEGVRYQYHVSEDGALLTDCRGEGAVVTGTGCTFAAEVTGARADHLGRTVDISVHVETSGLCEKFGAAALWVILDDVPGDYPVRFMLTSAGS